MHSHKHACTCLPVISSVVASISKGRTNFPLCLSPHIIFHFHTGLSIKNYFCVIPHRQQTVLSRTHGNMSHHTTVLPATPCMVSEEQIGLKPFMSAGIHREGDLWSMHHNVCICVGVYVHICMCVWVCVCVRVCVCVCVSVHTHTHTHMISIYIYIYISISIYIYIYIYINTQICIYI